MVRGTLERGATSPQFSGSKKKCAFKEDYFPVASIFDRSTRWAHASGWPFSYAVPSLKVACGFPSEMPAFTNRSTAVVVNTAISSAFTRLSPRVKMFAPFRRACGAINQGLSAAYGLLCTPAISVSLDLTW
jgi:hypothetical protein